MKLESVILVLILLAGAVAGCGSEASVSTPLAASADLAANGDGGAYTSVALGATYEGALPAGSQLVLGTFELGGAANAVTPAQAETLLPLWQVIQGGSLQNDAETNAVLKQIEGAMTAEQLAAIAAMQLTMADLGVWMQEQGEDFVPPSGAAADPGGFAPPDGMNEEEMAALRATAQAGGGMPGGGGFPGEGGPPGNMSEQERAAMRATAEAGGMTTGGGRGPAGASSGQLTMMAAQVVELLTARAAE